MSVYNNYYILKAMSPYTVQREIFVGENFRKFRSKLEALCENFIRENERIVGVAHWVPAIHEHFLPQKFSAIRYRGYI